VRRHKELVLLMQPIWLKNGSDSSWFKFPDPFEAPAKNGKDVGVDGVSSTSSDTGLSEIQYYKHFVCLLS